jgi:hypothetical protein
VEKNMTVPDKYDIRKISEKINAFLSDPRHFQYRQDIKTKLKDTIEVIEIATTIAYRADQLLSGNENDDQYLKKLQGDLKKFKATM